MSGNSGEAHYWAENVVIGCYTVLRMLESGRGAAGEKIGKSLFFCFHYGMFCLVHGVFVMTLFLSPEQHVAHRALSQGGGRRSGRSGLARRRWACFRRAGCCCRCSRSP